MASTGWCAGPADKVERRPIAELIPYARNARTHSPEQVAQIAASIREFGFTNPVPLDEASGIIAGHGRVLAAQKLGIVDLPCMVAADWSEAQKRAYVLALDDPAAWQDDEAFQVVAALDDLKAQYRNFGDGSLDLPSIIAMPKAPIGLRPYPSLPSSQ